MAEELTHADGRQCNVPPAFLTERDAAHFIGMSVFYLRQARRHGGGPMYHTFGRSIRYRLSDLEEWTRTRRSTPRQGGRR